mmetsp:Transcript_48853/g.122069  ORF Transcript_48853/g.122069 Transcript_48853/m.122069 type:complete len:265 (-) Transcript_48853:212-1006(-)
MVWRWICSLRKSASSSGVAPFSLYLRTMPRSAPCSSSGRRLRSSDSMNERCLGLPGAPQVSAWRRAISVTRRSDHSRMRRVSSSVGSVILGRRVRLGGAALAGGAWGRSTFIAETSMAGAGSEAGAASGAASKRARFEVRTPCAWSSSAVAGGATSAARLVGAGAGSPPGAPKLSARARSWAMSSAEAISKERSLAEASTFLKREASVSDWDEIERRNSSRSSSLRRRSFQQSRQLSTARLEPWLSSESTRERLSSSSGAGSIA